MQGGRSRAGLRGSTNRARTEARMTLDPLNDPALPVAGVLPAVRARLDAGGNAVLVAPPGAGKTTLAPLALLPAPWCGDGRILMLEPRRLATRAAAARMASLLGETVGRTVGYRTRLDSAASADTRVEVVTEGLLVRRLQSDPGLDGVACVIFDEVHERALDSDLAMAFCLDLQRELRPELRLLAMSATADAARLCPLMDATLIESAGVAHPVRIRHAARELSHKRDLPEAMARAIRAALAEEDGDLLCFLPGMAEIRRTAALLEGCGALVLPLHGDLPPADQDRALRPAETRRVVLATSIAETSLTVPDVRVVVDGGFRRAPRLDPSSGLTRLATLRISRAAAEQRAGRAGREGPGVAIRLWTEALHRGLPAHDRPEILEAELSSLLLDCAAWGAAPGDLPFLDPPPAGALASAASLFADLGALDADGRITEAGRRMARIGAHPRLAAMMLAAETPQAAALACDIAALLEERDPLRGRGPERPPADIALRLDALAHGDPNANRGVLARVRQAAQQYRRRLGLAAGTRAAGESGPQRAVAWRAGVVPPLRRRRGEAAAHRSPLRGEAACGRRAGGPCRAADHAGGTPRSGRPAASRFAPGDGDGGVRRRPRERQRAVAPPPAARRAGAARPHRTRVSRRSRCGADVRHRSRRIAHAELDGRHPSVPGPCRADAGTGTRGVAGPFRCRADRRGPRLAHAVAAWRRPAGRCRRARCRGHAAGAVDA